MARKKLVENELGLEQLIPQYGVNNTELNRYKKICKEEGDKIKSLMMANDSLLGTDGKRVKEAGDYVATVSLRGGDSLDEDKLLALFKSEADKKIQKEVIRQKEYIDSDAIEKLIYNGDLPKELLLKMDACHKEPTPTLSIKKKEGKKDGR